MDIPGMSAAGFRRRPRAHPSAWPQPSGPPSHYGRGGQIYALRLAPKVSSAGVFGSRPFARETDPCGPEGGTVGSAPVIEAGSSTRVGTSAGPRATVGVPPD